MPFFPFQWKLVRVDIFQERSPEDLAIRSNHHGLHFHFTYLSEFCFRHIIQSNFCPVFVQKSSMTILLSIPSATTVEDSKLINPQIILTTLLKNYSLEQNRSNSWKLFVSFTGFPHCRFTTKRIRAPVPILGTKRTSTKNCIVFANRNKIMLTDWIRAGVTKHFGHMAASNIWNVVEGWKKM